MTVRAFCVTLIKARFMKALFVCAWGDTAIMNVQIDIAGNDAQGRVFLTWTPVQATAKIVDGTGAGADVVLRSTGTVGGLVFDTVRSDQGAASLELSLPGDGQPVAFFVGGEFQKPSSAYGDAVVQATDKATGAVLGSKACHGPHSQERANLAGARARSIPWRHSVP